MEQLDALDMVILVLREHEKTLDGLINRIESALNGPQTGGLTYIQAISVVESQVYAVEAAAKLDRGNSLLGLKRILIQNYVYALNRRNLVPDGWVEPLIQESIMRLKEDGLPDGR